MNKIIPLSNPLMFRYIFGTNKNKKFTMYLLESLLNFSSKITDLKILNNPDLNNLEEYINLDIAIRLNNENQINLNIATNYDENSSKEIIMKTAKNYNALFEIGALYRDIPNLLQIEFVRKKKDDYIISRIGWVDEKTKEDVKGGFCILVINVNGTKYMEKYQAREDFEYLKNLINAENDEEIEDLANTSDKLKEIVAEMKIFSNNKK